MPLTSAMMPNYVPGEDWAEYRQQMATYLNAMDADDHRGRWEAAQAKIEAIAKRRSEGGAVSGSVSIRRDGAGQAPTPAVAQATGGSNESFFMGLMVGMGFIALIAIIVLIVFVLRGSRDHQDDPDNEDKGDDEDDKVEGYGGVHGGNLQCGGY